MTRHTSGESAAGRDESAAGRDDPAAGRDDPATGRDDPATGRDDPATGRDEPAAGRDDPATGRHDPAPGRDESAAGRDETAEERHALLIFLDGVGIGVRDKRRNPFFAARLPFLLEALGALPSLGRRTIDGPAALCIPADARLGVTGLPQSGTGQTTLYTGSNAARTIGRHFGPYVYSTLKPVLEQRAVYRQMLDKGIPHPKLSLANAFPQRFFDYLEGPRRRMVAGMMMALQHGIPFHAIDALRHGQAVSTDITAERWRQIGHPDAPVVTPYEAGRTLARITRRHRFTLYEYFLTDNAGHERDMDEAVRVLVEVDALLRGVTAHLDAARSLVIVTSDHGNLEDLSTRSHTRNPVPVLLWGDARHEVAASIRSIADITPALLAYLSSPS